MDFKRFAQVLKDWDDIPLKVMGAQGLYDPISNKTFYRNDTPEDGWIWAENVRQHEEEHKRQYNNPGDYNSEKAKRLAERLLGDRLLKRGYSRSELPYELMARMKGSIDHKDLDEGPQQPHPAWNQLDDEARQWYLNNSKGTETSDLWQRLKHVGGGMTSKLQDIFTAQKRPPGHF